LYSAGSKRLLKKAKVAKIGIKVAKSGIATAQIRHNVFQSIFPVTILKYAYVAPGIH